MLLEGKTAVVTGCNRGIGKAILENFAKNGADVFAVVRKEQEEFTLYINELMSEYKVDIIPIYMDLSNEDEVRNGAKSIIGYKDASGEKKSIDILVNNAGMSNPLNSFAMTKMETIRSAFEVNLFGPMLLTQLLARNMMRNKSGSIVFVSSSAAFDGGANIEYSASKAAIIGEVKRLAVEYGPYNVRVNAVAPGLTATDMGNSMSEEDEKIALSMNIMKRKGEPREIADTVAFLASDMSSFITAQVIRADGGLR